MMTKLVSYLCVEYRNTKYLCCKFHFDLVTFCLVHLKISENISVGSCFLEDLHLKSLSQVNNVSVCS